MSELWQRFQDGGWEMWVILLFLCLGSVPLRYVQCNRKALQNCMLAKTNADLPLKICSKCAPERESFKFPYCDESFAALPLPGLACFSLLFLAFCFSPMMRSNWGAYPKLKNW